MTRKPALLAATLPALALLGACGNDLESRQEAANELQPSERFIDGEAPAPRSAPAPTAAAEPEEEEADDEDDEEEVVVDASPDDLIDSAQGFSAQPMDDARGFDPSPQSAGPDPD